MENWLMKLHEKNFPRPKKVGSPLKSQFFQRNTLTVAKELLGKGLFVRQNTQEFLCELVEVEAYLGKKDEASHSAKGMTPRNQSMFAEGGTAYVYLIYGSYFCLNVSTEEKGEGAAVLFRAAIPLWGLEEMHKNRKLKGPLVPQNLLSGPGKLTQALGINKNFDGKKFNQTQFKIVDLGRVLRESQIGRSSRVGITKGQDHLFRFFVKDSPWLSKKGGD